MTQLARGAVGSALPTTAGTGQVLQWNGSAWVAATPSASGTTPNATTTVPGLVQLAGDLAGTAAAPTVPALAGKADKTALAAVATSGAYGDLTGRPALAGVATSGAYGDLTGRPALAAVATSGAYADLTGRPALAPVATSGSYADLTGAPTVPTLYLRAKTAATTTTSASASNDPDLQTASLPVGTYILEAFFIPAAGNAANTTILFAPTSGASLFFQYMAGSNGVTAGTSPSSAVTISSTTRAALSGSLTVTSAGAFAVTTASGTAGSQAGLAPGCWLRLTKVA